MLAGQAKNILFLGMPVSKERRSREAGENVPFTRRQLTCVLEWVGGWVGGCDECVGSWLLSGWVDGWVDEEAIDRAAVG